MIAHDDLVARISKTRDFTSCLQAAFSGLTSALEPGCGFGWNLCTLANMKGGPSQIVGVEINQKKLTDPRSDRAKQAGVILWKADAVEYLLDLSDQSYDGVLLVDFVEHFDPDKGKEILANAKRIAKKRVVLWGPMGSHPQDYDEWGTDGATWETHRWTMWPNDLEAAGYTAIRWDDYHRETNARGQKRDRGAMWGIFTR